MQPLVLLPLLVASAFAGDLLAGAPIAHSIEPLPQYTQEQNTATGEYGYSYQGGPSAKTEFRAIDGTTTGTYSYVDAHGILQTVNYIADEFGFRAAGSNIPTEGSVPLDAPDVAAAKAAHLAEHSRATLEALSQHRRKRGAILPSVAVSYGALPIAHAAIPVAHALPIATSSQHHVQIHNSARILTPSLLYRKKRGVLNTYAAPLPPSSAKILGELSHQPLLHAGIAAAPAAYAAPLAAPVLRAAPLAAPVLRAAPLAAPVLRAAPIVSHSVVESVPLATSSQHRFQIHSGAKIISQEIHHPVLAAAAAPAFPAYAPALPVGPIHTPALPAGPIYGEGLSHEFGAAAALPAEAATFADDAITVESA